MAKASKSTQKATSPAGDGASVAIDLVSSNGREKYKGDFEVATIGPEYFEKDTLLHVYRKMLTSRRLDEKMLNLLKQGKGFFHIGCAGH